MARKLSTLLGVLALVVLGWYLLKPTPTGEFVDGQVMADVTAPELSDEAAEGKVAYTKYCAVCHGANAAGQSGKAPPLVHKIYEPNHHADGAFYLAVKQGTRSHHWTFGNMPAVEGITDAEIAKVVVYVRELQRANGIN